MDDQRADHAVRRADGEARPETVQAAFDVLASLPPLDRDLAWRRSID